jgi:hypothetical protein
MSTNDVQRVYDAQVAHDFSAAFALQSVVSAEAYEEALNLYAASTDASRDHRYRHVAYLAFLAERARPDDTIGSVLDRLSEDELMELHAIAYPDGEDA